MKRAKIPVYTDSTGWSQSECDMVVCLRTDIFIRQTWHEKMLAFVTGFRELSNSQGELKACFAMHQNDEECKILCQVACASNASELLTIRLRHRHWNLSIDAIFESTPGKPDVPLNELFTTDQPKDCCWILCPDGRRAFVKLRRAPGNARANASGVLPLCHFELSIT